MQPPGGGLQDPFQSPGVLRGPRSGGNRAQPHGGRTETHGARPPEADSTTLACFCDQPWLFVAWDYEDLAVG